jgi:hypothetical protein
VALDIGRGADPRDLASEQPQVTAGRLDQFDKDHAGRLEWLARRRRDFPVEEIGKD